MTDKTTVVQGTISRSTTTKKQKQNDCNFEIATNNNNKKYKMIITIYRW